MATRRKLPGMDMGYDEDTYMDPSFAPEIPNDPGAPPPAGASGPYNPDPTDPQAGVTPPKFNVPLSGFDAGKMASADHAKKSPKYAFGQAAASGRYGVRDGGKMLEELQRSDPDFYTGWEDNGRGKFIYKGDPSKLHGAWGGETEIDYATNFNDDIEGNEEWWWGVGGGQDEAGGAGGGGFLNAPTGGGWQGAGGGYGSGSGSYSASGSSSSRPADFAGLKEALAGLFPGGGFNQDVVNARLDSARGQLEKGRTSRLATNRAMLAERGLIGSGPEATGANSIDEDTYDSYAGAVTDIYANESENADKRMMEALSLATGMTLDEAQMAINQFRAETERSLGEGQLGLGWGRLGSDHTLGLGNLALGNLNAVNNYNLGMANYGLGRDRLGFDMDQGDMDNWLRIIDARLRGADISSGGYIGRR